MATIENDNLSKSLKRIIGNIQKEYRNSTEFLDIISWNLHWFNSKATDRINNFSEILSVLNSDVFIFEEVQDESLEEVADILTKKGAGYYKIVYGTTGGDQRVAIMYDTEWVIAKDDIRELFGKKTVKTVDDKDAFPRLPLYGFFDAKSPIASSKGIDFQLVGVHLKSQMGDGTPQRRLAAEKLAYWLEKEASVIDSDTIIMGDWNKEPESSEWEAFVKLEKKGKVKFHSINDKSNISHLFYKNKKSIGSRLDIALVSTTMATYLKNNKVNAMQWITIQDLLESLDTKSAKDVKAKIKEVTNALSDHMPLFTRYYLDKKK